MAIRMKPDGTWEFDTPREAIEFQELQAAQKRERAIQQAIVPLAARIAAANERQVKPASRLESLAELGKKLTNHARTGKALQLIADAGSRGVLTEELCPKLGLENPKGISGVAQGMRRQIKVHCNGKPVDQILWSKGKPGKKRWFVDAGVLKEVGLI